MGTLGRRDFLRWGAGLAASAPALPELIRRLTAIPAAAPTGTIADVRHVVVFMQENRSFDHYFGTLAGVRGFGDPRPMPVRGGPTQQRIDPAWRQPFPGHPDGHVLPYPLVGVPNAVEGQRAPSSAICYAGLDHGWPRGHEAWNQGRSDRWALVKSPQTMAYHRAADLPFHTALAEAFTVCDAYHCSVMGPTTPNRLFLMSGTNGQRDTAHGPFIGGDDPFYTLGWTTYPERLQRAGISWQVYQHGLRERPHDPFGADNFSDNALQFFGAYGGGAGAGSPLLARGDSVRTLDDLRDDVRRGALPQVSWVVAPKGFSEHPQFSPAYGAEYTARLLDALSADEETWASTVLLIMYDENDGFFDHVAPPTPPAPSGPPGLSTVAVGDEIHDGGQPYGLGPRVPMIVVSPWTRGGWVCSQVFDHTSVIRFLEARFGVLEPNISAWRRAVCGDLTSAFDFAAPNAPAPHLPSVVAHVGARDTEVVPSPGAPARQAIPTQAGGVRPARTLPYRLEASGHVDHDQGAFTIAFANHGGAGAVFQVFAQDRHEGPWHYTVEAGRTLSDYWLPAPDGARGYDLAVYGPNGWLRCYRGGFTPGATAEVEARDGLVPGQLVLVLRNPTSAPCALTVIANAYDDEALRSFTVPAGGVVEDRMTLEASGGWYDLTVTIDDVPGFLRRLAGRVENGVRGTSDPAMGALIRAAPFDQAEG